ncbi:hypothetical protein ACG2F4_15520 [Halalkalibaculum sp. DA3122]|uniref:hypothetical protein n=1 Tax=Halalkalibaculum sp. DA3122 TaxID=3373607 RepID=UPI0037548C50
MKTLHLHIGSFKTGTTSIQNTFHNNRKNLNKLGFHYPGGKFNHHLSYFATKAPTEEWPRSLKAKDKDKLSHIVDQYFSKLEDDLHADFEHQIISTEYLFIDKEEYIKNYLDYLKKFSLEIKIYVFVRNPEELYKSIQQQIIKGRSYITAPQEFFYNFKNVIEVWQKYCPVKVLEFRPGVDSCETLCNAIGIDVNKLSKPDKFRNTSLSIQQILLLEKLQVNLYQDKENQLKSFVNIVKEINAPVPYPPKLKPEVQKFIQNKHRADLEWLKKNFGINFLKDYSNEISTCAISNFKDGKAAIRDVYQVDNEQSIDHYEALVIDTLIKKTVQDRSKSSILERILKFILALKQRFK